MYELTLSPQEIEEVTGYKRYTQQQKQLRLHGIPFTVGPNNRPIVLRRNFLQEIQKLPKSGEILAEEPDFSALDADVKKRYRKD